MTRSPNGPSVPATVARMVNKILGRACGIRIVRTASLRGLLDSSHRAALCQQELERTLQAPGDRGDERESRTEKTSATLEKSRREVDAILEGLSGPWLQIKTAQEEIQKQLNEVRAAEARLHTDIGNRFASLERLLRHIEADRSIARLVVGSRENELDVRILDLAALLTPRSAIGHTKTRLGKSNDGGYVLLNDFSGIKSAFSFGIGSDASWDKAIAENGIIVHQFDDSVDCPPIQHGNFRFQKTKIAASSGAGRETLRSLLERFGSDEPSEIILKADIEGNEWDLFAAATPEQLQPFSQIICEFHGFNSVGDDGLFHKMKAALSNLDRLFAVIHVHANNCAPMAQIGWVAFPEVLEVTYASRLRYQFEQSKELFPTEIDEPNEPSRPDYFLGSFVWPRRDQRAP
jgi:hypothetical protein